MINQINLLDHGYVKFIESWGSDERIIESARMSTDGSFYSWDSYEVYECNKCSKRLSQEEMILDQGEYKHISCASTVSLVKKPGDIKLLNYLYTNKHHTPFEMAGLIIEVQAPILVFREWHRHRTQSYNELSARYTPLPDLYYQPNVDRCMLNSKINKQAGTIKNALPLSEEAASEWLKYVFDTYDMCEKTYQKGLSIGIPKEVARVVMPVGHYSRMRASANLRNWLGFLTLRMDKSAQWEIRQYANALGTFIEQKFPHTWGLYCAK